jgi:AraC-like DNA-binding protein
VILAILDRQASPIHKMPDALVTRVLCSSPGELIAKFSAGSCDAVVLSRCEEPGIVADQLAAHCSDRPTATIWTPASDGDHWIATASGDSVSGAFVTGGLIRIPPSGLAARRVWLTAWARQISMTLEQDGASLEGSELARRLLLASLETRSVVELAASLHTTPRALRARLVRLRLSGPRRFQMAATYFLLWERLRSNSIPLEQAALSLGYSTLSALDHSVRRTLGYQPRDLRSISERHLTLLLQDMLSRRGNGSRQCPKESS